MRYVSSGLGPQTLLGQMKLLDLARGKCKCVNVNIRQTNQKKNLKNSAQGCGLHVCAFSAEWNTTDSEN